MIVAHLSDTHITGEGARLRGDIDTTEWLERAVDRINRDVRPDVVVHSGDVVQRGEPQEYARALAVLGRLEAPLFAAPGNHDERRAFLRAFGLEQRRTADRLAYEVRFPELRMLFLDSALHHWPGGYLDGATTRWLKSALDADADPCLIVMHHPPGPTGIALADAVGVRGAGALATIVSNAANVVGVICGHIHRVQCRPWMGTFVTTTRSTAPILLPEWGRGRVVYRAHLPGFAVHTIRGRSLSTEHVQLDR